VGLDRADVGLRRAGAHRHAKTGERERRHGAGHNLALLGEALHRLGVERDQVRGPAVESLLERRTGFLEDRHLVPARARERGGEFVDPGTAPWLVRTMSSAAWHTAPDDSPMRVVPIAHDHDFIVMATSLMISLFFILVAFLNAGQFPHDAVALPAPRNRCRVDPTARWTRCSH